MRLGRAAFWRFLIGNGVAAAGLVYVLPLASRFAPPSYQDMLSAAQPFAPLILSLLCLPSIWMGMRRLHDTGHSGLQAWTPLVPPALMGLISGLLPVAQHELLAAIQNGQTSAITVFLDHYAAATIIGLWLCCLLVGAAALRTFFLWLQPGDPDNNQYGPPPEKSAIQVAPVARATPLLQGRMPRFIFWPIVIANCLAVSGASYAMTHWLNIAGGVQQVSAFLYLPAFAAAMLRLHDRGQPGTLAGAVFLINAAAPVAEIFLTAPQTSLMNIPIDIATFYLLFQCWQPGDIDDNQYGPPRGEQMLSSPPISRAPASAAPTRPTASRRPAGGFGRRGI